MLLKATKQMRRLAPRLDRHVTEHFAGIDTDLLCTFALLYFSSLDFMNLLDIDLLCALQQLLQARLSGTTLRRPLQHLLQQLPGILSQPLAMTALAVGESHRTSLCTTNFTS